MFSAAEVDLLFLRQMYSPKNIKLNQRGDYSSNIRRTVPFLVNTVVMQRIAFIPKKISKYVNKTEA